MSNFKKIASLGLSLAIALALSACAPEEYGVCSIPNTTSHKAACTATSNEAATCVVKYVFDCESLLCGIYNDDGPYCTRRCVPSDEQCSADGNKDCSCPAGEDCESVCPDGGTCREWTKGTSAYYCVRPD